MAREGKKWNLSGLRTVAEKIVAFLDKDGKKCKKDDAAKTIDGSVVLIESVDADEKKGIAQACGIPNLSAAVAMFDSETDFLCFVADKINATLKINAINGLVAGAQGPDKTIADFAEKLRKIGVPEAEIEIALSAVRASVSGATK